MSDDALDRVHRMYAEGDLTETELEAAINDVLRHGQRTQTSARVLEQDVDESRGDTAPQMEIRIRTTSGDTRTLAVHRNPQPGMYDLTRVEELDSVLDRYDDTSDTHD